MSGSSAAIIILFAGIVSFSVCSCVASQVQSSFLSNIISLRSKAAAAEKRANAYRDIAQGKLAPGCKYDAATDTTTCRST